jgi:hypothetical protein
MLPRITDEMLAGSGSPSAPTVPALDDRSLAEMLAELEGDDRYALRELLADDSDTPAAPAPAPGRPSSAPPAPAPRRADAVETRPRAAGSSATTGSQRVVDHDQSARAEPPRAVPSSLGRPTGPPARRDARRRTDQESEHTPASNHHEDAAQDDLAQVDLAQEEPAQEEPAPEEPAQDGMAREVPARDDPAGHGPDDSAPSDQVPSDIDPAFHHQRVVPKQAVDDDRVEFRQSAAGPVLRSRYGDFRPPVGRTPQTPSLTGLGLTRRASGKLGSRLFVVVFVGIFLLIAIQLVVSLVSSVGTP